MKNIYALILIGVLVAVAIYYFCIRQTPNCHVIEYTLPPDDAMHALDQDEINLLNEMTDDDYTEDEEDDEDEDFRVHRTGGAARGGMRGGSGAARGGVARGGGMRGGGGGMRGGGRRRHGRRGRRSGRGHGGYSRHHGGYWPWRRWPRYLYGRPWRTAFWQYYPDYVYSYPLTYYNDDWISPVQRFTVRIGPKGDRHPFEGKGSDYGYMITSGTPSVGMCGTSGARLDLVRGETYEFDVYTSKDCITGQDHDDPFFFTTDPEGGEDAGRIFNTVPVRNGTVRITITDNIPSQFYYQSATNILVGGYVFVN